MSKPKIGDVVQLASGGPKMTVGSDMVKGETTRRTCLWFVAGKLEQGDFHEDALIKAPDDPGPLATLASGTILP